MLPLTFMVCNTFLFLLYNSQYMHMVLGLDIYVTRFKKKNHSKLHIWSFEINNFKDLKLLLLAKGSKHVYEIYTRDASIYHLLLDYLIWQLYSFLPNKIENLTMDPFIVGSREDVC